MVFLFFKQKTAYEMRISDWSSDVCSSDLNTPNLAHEFCDDFTRSALTGEINFLSATPINTGREQMSGLDLGVVYNRRVADWNLSADLSVSYLNEYVITDRKSTRLNSSH